MNLTAITPAQLTAGCAESWEVLRASYRPLCVNIGYRYNVEPDDLWQELALRLWQALRRGAFDGRTGGEFGVYLSTAARTAAIDLSRARRVSRAHLLPLIEAAHVGVSLPEPADLSALDLLTEAQRYAMWATAVRDDRPHEVLADRPDLYASPQEVYDALRCAKGRLQRAARRKERNRAAA